MQPPDNVIPMQETPPPHDGGASAPPGGGGGAKQRPRKRTTTVNLGNYTLSPLKIITGLPTGIGAHAAIRWADINGNGTTDLVYADSLSERELETLQRHFQPQVMARPGLQLVL